MLYKQNFKSINYCSSIMNVFNETLLLKVTIIIILCYNHINYIVK